MTDGEVRYYFRFLLLMNIRLDDSAKSYIQKLKEFNEENKNKLRGFFWDSEKNAINEIVRKQFDVYEYTIFLENISNRSFKNFREVEEFFDAKKHKFLILEPVKKEKKSLKNKEAQSCIFFKQNIEKLPKSKPEIFNLFITKLKRFLTNPKNKKLERSINKTINEYPVIEWLRGAINLYADNWLAKEHTADKNQFFVQLTNYLKLYLSLPGAKFSDIKHPAIEQWKKHYRTSLADWISELSVTSEQRSLLKAFDSKLSFALTTEAITPFSKKELSKIQELYKCQIVKRSSNITLHFVEYIKLRYQFIKLSMVQQLMLLCDKISSLDEIEAQREINQTLLGGENSLFEKYCAFYEEYESLEASLPRLSNVKKLHLYKLLGSFNNDFLQLAEYIFTDQFEQKHKMVLITMNHIIHLYEEVEESQYSHAASSSSRP